MILVPKELPAAIDRDQFDLGKLFAEFVEQRLAAVAADVKVELSFFLWRRQRSFPNSPARRLCIGGEQCASDLESSTKKTRMTSRKMSHGHFPSRPFINSLTN